MPKITVLPHASLCPEGAVIEDAPEGKTVLDVLLDHDILRLHHLPRHHPQRLRQLGRADRTGRRPARPGMGLGSRLAPELSGSGCR